MRSQVQHPTKGFTHALVGLALLLGATSGSARAQAAPGDQGDAQAQSLPVARQGNFFVGGHYDKDGHILGQMYVEYQIPKNRTHRIPLVFIPGYGQMGQAFWFTPDGRPGWAPYFLKRGYAVFVVDQPARGRSTWNSEDGELADPSTALVAQQLFTSPERFNLWPAAHLHTQWVGRGVPGDYVFDQFLKSQEASLPGIGDQEGLTSDALVALVDRIGPAVLIPHSQPGSSTWLAGDRRPNLVKAIVALEPGGPPVVFGPPIISPGTPVPWGITFHKITYKPAVSDPSQLSFVRRSIDDKYVKSCLLQAEPARQLPNLARVKILMLSSEAGYNTMWDPCTTRYLRQAGVSLTWTRLEDIGIHGNSHFDFIERNSDQVAGVVLRWLRSHVADQMSESLANQAATQ